jgi:[glutamine synthetase] adenylyltransferase / [glutamine synthetase]-adenylyl-L-tyrosine phosphorylase
MLLASLDTVQPPEDVLSRSLDGQRSTSLYRKLLARAILLIENGANTFGAMLDRELRTVPDPERTLLHLDRIVEASFNPAALLEMLCRYDDRTAALLKLLCASEWVTDTLVRDAELLRWLLLEVDRTERERPAFMHEAVAVMHHFTGVAPKLRALRRFQRRELLRIVAADLLDHRDVTSITRELSALADVIIQLVWEIASEEHAARLNVASFPPVTILALGKLGGEELNYSSDIDLMIVYDVAEAEDIASTHDIVIATVKDFVRMLSEASSEGVLYRSDLRLRPDGSAGPLALSLRATLLYYETRGAEWERQMLLRARVCAGDAGVGKMLLHALQPFIHPRSLRRLPSDVLSEALSRLKNRSDSSDDVKHMKGGIRHIEFTLQALQRIHGRNASVHTPSTLKSISMLTAEGALHSDEARIMTESYRFLRRLEHAIQIDRFEQTHSLPADGAARSRFAWMLGYSMTEDFEVALASVRSDVIRTSEALALGAPGPAPSTKDITFHGFTDPEKSRAILHDLLSGRSGKPHNTTHRHKLAALLPELLADIKSQTLPDTCLAALEGLLHRAPSTGEIVTLLEHRQARQLLLRLASLAPVQLRSLDADPLALELVLSGWDETLDDTRLRRVAETSALLRLLENKIDIDEYGVELSRVADTVLKRHLSQHEQASAMLIMAMGKYGARELLPGSDLDVVFLHDDHSIATYSAQELVLMLLRDMRAAGYTMDARLRPEGGGAPLSISLSAWKEYMKHRASLWEKQSLLRARLIGGSDALSGHANALLDDTLSTLLLGADDIRSIDAMRKRIDTEHRFHRTDTIDIKRSAGGLVDVEFIRQMLQLAASSHANPAAVDDMREDSTVTHRLEWLSEHYNDLRLLQLRLRLIIDTPSNLFPTDAAQRILLARSAAHTDGDSYEQHIRNRMQQARERYNAITEILLHRLR